MTDSLEARFIPSWTGPRCIATHTIGSQFTYALVASYEDDGVQIIDITDPKNPAPAAHVSDGADYPELDGPNRGHRSHGGRQTTTPWCASSLDHGVQIIDITDPENPAPGRPRNGRSPRYPDLDGAFGIATHTA